LKPISKELSLALDRRDKEQAKDLAKNMAVENRSGYKHDARCKICTALDYKGKSLRDEVDALAASGGTHKQVQDRLASYGVFVSLRVISNHFTKHSPFVNLAREMGSSKSQRFRLRIKKEVTEASEAVQKIINIGDQMVDNWAKGKQGPQMPVTEKLYIEALKEQGKSGTKTTLDMEFEQMDREAIEGKLNG
jgi:hypothetical protein